jgi:hypothetical protein
MITTGKMPPSVVRSGMLRTYDNFRFELQLVCVFVTRRSARVSGFIPVFVSLFPFVCGNTNDVLLKSGLLVRNPLKRE